MIFRNENAQEKANTMTCSDFFNELQEREQRFLVQNKGQSGCGLIKKRLKFLMVVSTNRLVTEGKTRNFECARYHFF